MRRNFLSEAQKYIAKNRRRRVWKDIVIILACIVVFCTTYALILPAITTEKDTLEDVVGDAVYQETLSDINSDGTTGNEGETTTLTLGTGEIDFKNFIKSVSIQYRQNQWDTWRDLGTNEVQRNDQLRFNIKYVVPGNTLSYDSPSIVYELPKNITLVNEVEEGEVTNDAGSEIGTYSIKDGKIKITFYKEYIDDNINGQPISGSIKFESSVDKITADSDGNINLKFNDKLQPITINVEKEAVETGDLNVVKTASEVNDGKVTYTITVSSEQGTGSQVKLNDFMSNVAYDSGFRVTKNGSTVSGITGPTANSKEFELTLDKMTAGDIYEISYTANFDDVVNGSIEGYNKVTVRSTNNNGDNLKDSADVKSNFTNELIKKSGKLIENNSKIEWTVIINSSKQNISNYVLSDILNGIEFKGDVTILPEGGTASTIKLPHTFPEGSNNTYTITYITDADKMIGQGAAMNKAELKSPKPEEKVFSSGDIWVGDGNAFNPLNKTAESITKNNDGKTANIRWNISIDASEGDIPKGWIFTDLLQNGQWFAETEQTEQIKSFFTGLNSTHPNTFEWIETDVTVNGQSQKMKTGFKVTFENGLRKGETINFSCESTAPLSDGSSVITFENKSNINETVWSSGKIEYTPVVYKYDLNSENKFDKTTEHNFNDINGTLKWGFVVDIPENAQDQDIIITENLPEGIDKNSLKLYIDDNNSKEIVFFEEQGTIVINGYTITATKNNNTITINIPKELIQNRNSKKYKFEIDVKIDEDFNWNVENNVNISSFKNEVIVKKQDNTDLGSYDQTQTITKDYVTDDKVLKKSHGDWNDTNIVPYSIVVNTEGRDLLEGSDKLILKDVIRYQHQESQPFNINLVPNSLHIYRRNQDGTKGQELSSNQIKYTFVSSPVTEYGNVKETYTLSIEVPDKEALIIEYKYKVDAKVNDWIQFTNTATIEGENSDSYKSEDSINIQISDSSAIANTDGITIYKVDSRNNATVLSGAEFELYRWNGNEYVKVGSTFVTNNDGKFTIENDENSTNKLLTYNTAYKLVEVKAPKGYIQDNKPHYFSIINTDTTTYPICKPDDFNGVNYPIGSIIYFSNKMDSTSITVNKKWFDVDGNDVTGQTGGEISFELWQKANSMSSMKTVNLSVDITKSLNWEDNKYTFWQYTGSIPKNSQVTLKLTLKGAYQDIENGKGDYKIYINGELKEPDEIVDGKNGDKTYVYTFPVSEETQITGNVSWYNLESWTYDDLVIGDPEEPEFNETEGVGSVGVRYNVYTIKNTNDWKIVINDLPRKEKNEQGEIEYYTYYVNELDVKNYTTSYENNGGIASGTITIKNTLDEKPEYVLPETGRFGGDIWFILGGMLLMAGSLVYIYKRKHKRV